MAKQVENSQTAKKIVKLMKQRLGHYKEMLDFLEALRVQEMQSAEPDGVWYDLEENAAN